MRELPKRFDLGALEDLLREAGTVFRGRYCRCPFHEDQQASGWVRQGNDGAWRYKCNAASCGVEGDYYDILAHMTGRPVAEVIKEEGVDRDGRRPAEAARPRQERPRDAGRREEGERPKRVYATIGELREAMEKRGNRVQDVYPFYGALESNEVVALEVRFFKPEAKGPKDKSILPAKLVEGGGYVFGGPPTPWPLYNLPMLGAAALDEEILVVEGPRKAKYAAMYGLTAVSAGFGAGKGKVGLVDWSVLAGRRVTLWPDNDEEGRKHPNGDPVYTGQDFMRDVAGVLKDLTPRPRLRILEPSTLGTPDKPFPVKGDIVDFIELLQEEGYDKDRIALALRGVVSKARPLGPGGEFRKRIEDIIAGRYISLLLPYRGVYELSQALIPGSITLLCGEAGGGKSFLLNEIFMYFAQCGVKMAIMHLEKDPAFHFQRMAAQQEGSNRFIDSRWMHQNPEEALKFLDRWEGYIDEIGHSLWATPRKSPSKKELVAWCEERAKENYRVLAIDPVTQTAASREPWIEDQWMMTELMALVDKYQLSVILSTHPNKTPKTGPGLDGLAGGTAFARFCDTAWWLHGSREPKLIEASVYNDAGHERVEICETNRTITLLKTRNGKGCGMSVGFWWEPTRLEFREVGVVRRELKGEEKKAQKALVKAPVRTTPHIGREPEACLDPQEEMDYGEDDDPLG